MCFWIAVIEKHICARGKSVPHCIFQWWIPVNAIYCLTVWENFQHCLFPLIKFVVTHLYWSNESESICFNPCLKIAKIMKSFFFSSVGGSYAFDFLEITLVMVINTLQCIWHLWAIRMCNYLNQPSMQMKYITFHHYIY